MLSHNQNFLDNRYIPNTDIDINAMMNSVTRETIDGTFNKLKDERDLANKESYLGRNLGINNHTIFAQNMVKETSTNKFFKSSQMFLNNIECESNTGLIDFDFLATAFNTTQGLVELPIHTILKIGGMYDFYYYNDYEKDDKIDLDVINGLKTKNGYDLFDDPIIKNKHYGTYVFGDKNLILATAPFVKPITPKHIDDSVGDGSDSFSKTNISKNYKEKYYDYDLDVELSLSNNIASHIPFSGYGVLNNYMNAMSHFFFGQGLDGSTDITDTTNNNGIPYHIIGNFKGNLKTFKTYNDTQLNFLASYNSFGTKIKHDLNGLRATLSTLTKTITIDTDFVFSKSAKKTEFFLLLSKIKANYLGGYISTDYLYTIIKDLCKVNNLNAKHDNLPLYDFAALLIHLLFYPDGAEKDSRRPNKTLRILSLYDVDPNSFTQAIAYNTTTLLNLTNFLANIVNESPEEGGKQYEQVTYLLLSLWSKESKPEINNRLSAIDDKGTYVVYPSCGGEINIKELFSNKNYTYNKTNNTTTVIDSNDLLDPYITGLTISSFDSYVNINNDILSTLNFDYKTFYSNIPNIKSSENPYTDILGIKGFGTLKYSQKTTKPKSVSENDEFFLPKYDQVLYNGGLTTLDIEKSMVSSYLDRYDDLYIIANTTDPNAIIDLNFNNNNLVNNTSKLFWFDNSINIFQSIYSFKSQNDGKINASVEDDYEWKQYGYDGNERQLYDLEISDNLRIFDYSKFEKDKYFYFNYFNSDLNKNTLLTTDKIGALIDIFGVDKLEDFRSLFKNFADTNIGNYFTETFNTFNFQSLIKHTNIFGYTHLPDSITLDRVYIKEEISAFLCGYSGHFIEFASKNDISKIINYALTVGQENKAKIVIDEFMNAKITINNYSTTGPLYVDNTVNNPEGLRLNSNIFNPIIMYASETRTPDNIIGKLDYRLLFRTLLFGDQSVNPYDLKTIPDNFNTLVDKYLGTNVLYSVEPTLEKILLPELTRIFFSTLNIEITEGNLKLLLAYLKSYIHNYIGSESKSASVISKHGFDITGLKIIDYRNATIYPSSEGEVDKDFDSVLDKYVITKKVEGGEIKPVGKVKYLFNTINELNPVDKLKEFIDNTNKDILTKQIEAFNTGLKKFSELAKSKIDTLYALEDPELSNEKYKELDKSAIELRTGTYYRIKTLYDRSVSFNNIDLNDTSLIKKTSKELANIDINAILKQPLFFNFNIETDDNDYENCNDKNIIADKDGDELKDLYDYALVLDRGNNDYGSKVLANIDGLKKVIADDLTNVTQVDNTLRSNSMWTVLSNLATDHEFLLMPLTSYINLNGAVKSNTDPFELAHDMFGVFNNLEMFDSNPAFIFQLGSLTSNISAGNKQKKNSFSEFDLSNTFCMDIETNQLGSDGYGKLLDEGIPNDILNSNVSSFIVDFGNKDQNMFQNIQLSTDEFANTEESIFTQVNLTSNSGNIAQLSTGKLFTAMENRSYSCTVTSLGNASIQPLTYFYVKNVPLFYGTYWITNVSHKITPNNMTTTFKGVRQPIAKKPTANTSILKQLFKRALVNYEQDGFFDINDPVQVPTDGTVYAYDNRNSPNTGTDSGFALFAQARTENTNEYVTYSGLNIVASYLHLMTNGDQNNKLLIKALIAYLYNNASLLEGSSSDPKTAIKYFTDIVLYDMVIKLDVGRSLYDLLKTHPTKGTEYETILLEFSQKSDADVFEYLKHDKPIKGIKTTLITSDTGGVVANDSAKAKITYPDNIEVPSTDTALFRGASYWVSDKPDNNVVELQSFSRHGLTNIVFKTNGPSIIQNYAATASLIEFKPKSIIDAVGDLKKGTYFYVIKYKNVNNAGYTATEYPNPIPVPNLVNPTQPTFSFDANNPSKNPALIASKNPNLTLKQQPYGIKEIYGLFNYDPVSKELVKTDIIVDATKFIQGGELKIEVYDAMIEDPNQNTQFVTKLTNYKKIGDVTYLYNSGNIQTGNNPPVVLGFGSTIGTTKSADTNGKFIYGKSYGDPYTPIAGETVRYQAGVLGAISNGNSYISFIAIAPSDELITKTVPQRSVRSYINKNILGDKNDAKKQQKWTILDKQITSEMIYKPEIKKYSNGKKTKVSGWVNPLKSITIISDYGDRVINGKKGFHEGVDLKAKTPLSVFAVLDGKVVFAGERNPTGYGRLVVIAHQDKGVSTLYGHLSQTKISDGSTVKAGDIIGLTGEAGNAAGKPHLHFEVRTGIATSYENFTGLPHTDPETYLNYNGALPDVKKVTSAGVENNKIEIKEILQSKGWSKIEVAAALGNIDSESDFNPNAGGADVNKPATRNIGLIQWNNKTITDVGSTVASQMNYLVEGGWKSNTEKFRSQLKNEIPNIKLDMSVPGNKVSNLSPEELQVYVAAYIFAKFVEVCERCTNWENYNTEGLARTGAKLRQYERSQQAVAYYKRMNDPNDKLKW